MVFQLDNKLWFPNPVLGDSDGMLAVGGDLSIDRLLLAYSYGIFPWYDFRHSPIQWWCPLERFVIFPSDIHISHSMRTLMNKGKYVMSFNQAFDEIIKNCGNLRLDEDGAWLGPEMTKAYQELHRQGFAVSVEVWDNDDNLVGGLYGVTIGKCFMGESMFSLVPNASKLALIFLADYMKENGGLIIDCQFETPHLKSMGGKYIPYREYMDYLRM